MLHCNQVSLSARTNADYFTLIKNSVCAQHALGAKDGQFHAGHYSAGGGLADSKKPTGRRRQFSLSCAAQGLHSVTGYGSIHIQARAQVAGQ